MFNSSVSWNLILYSGLSTFFSALNYIRARILIKEMFFFRWQSSDFIFFHFHKYHVSNLKPPQKKKTISTSVNRSITSSSFDILWAQKSYFYIDDVTCIRSNCNYWKAKAELFVFPGISTPSLFRLIINNKLLSSLASLSELLSTDIIERKFSQRMWFYNFLEKRRVFFLFRVVSA